MKIVGIVAEFNPFHNGHKYLIDKAKELTKADVAICIMSGGFTQAGNVAVQDKFTRAKIAVEQGIDAVIELPVIFATSSSEYFAFGAVNILNSLGCVDYICFGSESGNTDELITIAKKVYDNNAEIWHIITDELRSGISFAVAREKATAKFLTEKEIKISSTSNNILAIQYIKSLIQLKSKIIPIAIKREEGKNVISATKIRALLFDRKDVSEYIPYTTKFTTLDYYNTFYYLLKYSILSTTRSKISDINEVAEGLENKFYSAADLSESYSEFLGKVKSKRYQMTRIKRITVNVLLNITKSKFVKLNSKKTAYAHILAINPDKKRTLLSLFNKKGKIPIITSLSDKIIEEFPTLIKDSINLDIHATRIHSLIMNERGNKDYINKL